jgi:P-type Ca2+ transporter type 2C
MEQSIEISLDFHAKTIPAILAYFHSDKEKGLSQEGFENNKKIFGDNTIPEGKSINWLWLFLKQWNNPVVYLLLLAVVFSFFLREYLNALSVLVVLLFNTLIGFIMEMQAERSMRALKKLSVTNVHVVRDGKFQMVNCETLVPGDVIHLEAGDVISADARIIEANGLQVNESVLTGESIPVAKNNNLLSVKTRICDQVNMLFKGTHITQGNTIAVVVKSGKETVIGQIADAVKSAETPRTPLEQRMQQLSRKLVLFSLVLLVLVFIPAFLRGLPILQLVEISIAMAIAAIPEGLPVVVTITLAHGVLKMAKNNVVIRKLSAVESLGVTDLICVDKTGTLTENKLKVQRVVTKDCDWTSTSSLPQNKLFEKMVDIAVLCNNAELITDHSLKVLSHDPLEEALIHFAISINYDVITLRKKYKRLSEIPFNSQTRMMSTRHQYNNLFFVFFKGSVDALLSVSTHSVNENNQVILIDETQRVCWRVRETEMAATGLRVIAAAYSVSDSETTSTSVVFLGLYGFLDPPIITVADSIYSCQKAGIEVAMLTGDHPATAKNIAQRLGLMRENTEVILGDDLEKIKSDEGLRKRILSCRVFARVDPSQKLELVRIFQEKGRVVAMTGDGVNDGPALTQADIGIAMGQRGTQVAQEASAMVLKDDSFQSIVLAVRQGRIIFQNIRMFLVYLMSCNLSEIITVSSVTLLFPGSALIPIQILFMNLITDVFPALALGFSQGNQEMETRKPKLGKKEFLDKIAWIEISCFAIALSICTLLSGFFHIFFQNKLSDDFSSSSNSVIFCTLVFSQLLHVLNMSQGSPKFFPAEITGNRFIWLALIFCFFIVALFTSLPVLRFVLGLTTMDWKSWTVVLICSLLILPLGFIFKKIIHDFQK